MYRDWLLHPTTNKLTLNRRFRHISFFLQPSSEDLSIELQTHLKSVKNVVRMMKRFKSSRLKLSDWISVRDVINIEIKLNIEIKCLFFFLLFLSSI